MPTRKLLTALAGLVLVAGSVSTLGAADLPLNPGVKFRFGVTGGALHEDMNKNAMVGISITADLATWGQSAIFGELGYMTMNGDNKTMEFGAAGTQFPGGLVQASTSADTRRNSLNGFTLRGGFRSPLVWGWNYQAGLTFDSLKYTQEALGQLVGTGPGGINESIAAKPTENKLNVGAFAGLHRPFGESFSFEVNVSTVGYSSVNYMPRVYTGVAAASETKTRRGYMLDIALGMKF